MEEGSLVQEALRRIQEQRQDNDGFSLQNNTLIVDMFLLDSHHNAPKSSQEERLDVLQRLAKLGNDCNSWIQTRCKNWPWHAGGDGLVFGIHSCENKRPHLRASCCYGENVQEEWFVVAIMLVLSKIYSDIAIKCWDVDDGQVLLIESALVLPPWIQDSSSDTTENSCWITRGQVVLLQNRHDKQNIPLNQALQMLQSYIQDDNSTEDSGVAMLPRIQEAIANRVQTIVAYLQQAPESSPSTKNLLKHYLHRTVFVAPRRVAILMQQRPDLVSCALVTWFHKQQQQQQHVDKSTILGKFIHFEDLVWTTHTLTRTSYAMMQSTCQNKIPRPYQSMETNRMKRTCQMESTPHLRHALENGVYVTAGLECLLSNDTKQQNDASNISVSERRIVQHWAQVDVSCGGNGEWLRQSWQEGPNHALHDLEDLMKCPVYEAEIHNNNHNPCPLSHAGMTHHTQIKLQLNKSNNKDFSDKFNVPPKPQDVDDDAWLEFDSVQDMDDFMMDKTPNMNDSTSSKVQQQPQEATTTRADRKSQHDSKTKNQVEDLTTMLDSFQTFVSEKSQVEGISHNPENKDHSTRDINVQDMEEVHINPRVFMNLLHKVLKSSPEEQVTFDNGEENDPYFTNDDYNLLLENESSSESDVDANGEEENDESLTAVMRAMDDELRGTHASMGLDQVDQSVGDDADGDVARNTHVLSNLLESLDASGGGPGPVHNILKEMGVEPPKLPKENNSDS